MAKKKQLSKDLYTIAKKCPHLQLCKSAKKGTWLDCRLKKGCDCFPGAAHCTRVNFVPHPTTCEEESSFTRWLVSTPAISLYQSEPQVNWTIDVYSLNDVESTERVTGKEERKNMSREDENSTITDKQLDEMIANLSDDKPMQEVILDTIKGLQEDVKKIQDRLLDSEPTSPKKVNAYLIYPAFRPVRLYKKNGHYLYSYYNETLGSEVISNVTGTEKFVNMDELNTSLYRRYQELVEQTHKNGKEKQEILAQLKEQALNI